MQAAFRHPKISSWSRLPGWDRRLGHYVQVAISLQILQASQDGLVENAGEIKGFAFRIWGHLVAETVCYLDCDMETDCINLT